MSNENKEVAQGEEFVTRHQVETARKNSRWAVISSVISVCAVLTSLATSAWMARARNSVAAIPIGQVWEYPMVHWVNSPTRYEEDAKPMHVAMKYVRGLYEVDPMDYSQSKFDNESIMLSSRIAELMAYTLPGTKEFIKVSTALEKSQTLFKIFSECKCVKRFLVSDMMIVQPPMATMRIELVGRFVIFGQDGRRPVAAEDLGFKSVVLYMAHDIPSFDTEQQEYTSNAPKESQTARDQETTRDAGDTKMTREQLKALPKAVNPEGWYIVRSQIKTLTPKEVQDLRNIRLDAGMKGIY